MIKLLSNKQACEQLNAWLGGFESILKRMVPGNFDWFLHTMLFYHTRYVLRKQDRKRKNEEDDDSESDESDDGVGGGGGDDDGGEDENSDELDIY
jgi:hypothetical protein